MTYLPVSINNTAGKSREEKAKVKLSGLVKIIATLNTGSKSKASGESTIDLKPVYQMPPPGGRL